MKQSTLNLDLSLKRTRQREFIEQMDHVVPWPALVKLIAPLYSKGHNAGRQTQRRTDRPVVKRKTGICPKVEHPFRVIKRQLGYAKLRYKGLKKNSAQSITLFALSNVWMARHKRMALLG